MSLATVSSPSKTAPKIRFRKTSLVSFRTDDVWSAALSIAANHASKVAKLQDAGQTSRADEFLQRLSDDVAEFKRVYRGQHRTEMLFFQRLDVAATPIPLTAPKTDLVRDDAVRMENGLTGRVSHDYTSGCGTVRMVAVRVVRTSSDPNSRHGSRWEQQWSCRADVLTRIAPGDVQDYPED